MNPNDKKNTPAPAAAPKKEETPEQKTPPTAEPPKQEEPKKEEEQKAAPKSLDDKLADAVERGIALGIATSAQVQQNAAMAAKQAGLPARGSSERCQECRQLRVACGGKHRYIAVFPSNPENGEWFPGIRLNHVLYISNHAGHRIAVPEDFNIEHAIQEWEQSEREMLHGKKVFRNSGEIALGDNSRFVPALQPYR